MPDASIDTSGDTTVFESCDPGAKAETPSDANIREAIAIAAGRDALTATVAGQHASGDLAACAARLLTERPDFRDAFIHPDAAVDRSRTERMLHESFDAGVTCRANDQAGLP